MSVIGECFSGMKVVKWFTYETRFLERKLNDAGTRSINAVQYLGISDLRTKELSGVFKIEMNGSIK